MPTPDTGTFFGSLRTLFSSGVRYATVIDIGCADGHFCLSLISAGLAPGVLPLNIDPNPIYKDSLRAIQETIGGHFRICAITDHEGDVELTMSAHPYWASLRPKGDLYWDRVNKLSESTVLVPATTLDTLREQLTLQPPYLLKLDVQGAEAAVLRGASDLLKNTHVVICEADIDDFQTINSILIDNGFVLFDLTTFNYLSNGTLGWFYPVYINQALDFVRPKAFWDSKDNNASIQMQVERRKSILKSNADILDRIQNPRPARQPTEVLQPTPQTGRNQPCPCGSGKKYKHCCGAYR